MVGWKGSEGTDAALFLAPGVILSRSGARGSWGGGWTFLKEHTLLMRQAVGQKG